MYAIRKASPASTTRRTWPHLKSQTALLRRGVFADAARGEGPPIGGGLPGARGCCTFTADDVGRARRDAPEGTLVCEGFLDPSRDVRAL